MNKNVDYDAWQKLQLAPLTNFNPQVLQSLKYSQHSGYLLELERLYSTMYLEWPTLKKDASDMTEAVAGLTWTVAPFCQDGGEPDELAKEVAKVVSDALWMVSPQKPGEFSHCFTELLGSMVHALYRSVNVHEIVWKFTPELVFPLEYKQLGPQYYMWETRQGEPDRLMLVPDGMDYTRPVPFEPGRFVVALNTTGPDHPMYNADFYSLVGYFVAAKFGLPGLQSFVKRYGHPLRKFTVEDQRRREQLEAKLKSMPDVYDVFLGPGEELDVTAIPAGANVPHEVLLRVAENACHQLIKGNTLTSDVGDKGGSRAQAEVHMGVEASLVRKRGEFVARVLNRQLIPYIVQRNYGRTDLPMPELRCQVPEQKANIQKAQYWQAVLGIPGMRVLKSAVHDDLGLAVPGDGDEVYAAPEPTQGMPHGAPAPAGFPEGEPEVGMAARAGGKGSLRERAERLLPVAMRKWAEPTIERFEAMLRAGRKPEEILARLEELLPNTRALADAMSAVTEAGLGVQGDAVSAENPYGCNQYGEGWSEPHDGSSTERIGKDKLLTKKDADGNVRQIATKKRYPGKAAYLGVGKDGKKGEEPKPEPKPEKKPEPKKKENPEPEPKPKAPEKKPKVEKKEPESERNKPEVLKGQVSPEDFVKAAGLTLDGEDGVEALSLFLDGLRNRHPENAAQYERIVTSISSTDGRTKREKAEAVAHIESQLRMVLCMASPDVVSALSTVEIRQQALRPGLNGSYYVHGSRKMPVRHIEYKKGVSDETVIHEFVHHMHACASDETWNKITDYFRERTKDDPGYGLRCGQAGKSDHFATTFDPNDDYAGRIYRFDSYGVKNGKAEARARANSNNCGTEMVTRHLQKLALPAEQFARYWNDKQDGKYYWREAFVMSLNLLLNP